MIDAECATGLDGLYRTHERHNLTSVATAIVDAFADRGPVRLGPARRLAVIAVDGLGYGPAAETLRPGSLTALTTEFPSTTAACMLTSLTGRHAYEHGLVGVVYLDQDGRGLVNCHDGRRIEPDGDAPDRPTVTPSFPTVFTRLAEIGIPASAVPNELDLLHPGVRDRLFRDCAASWPRLPTAAGPEAMAEAFAAQLTAVVDAAGTGLIWSYLDLDSHAHRYGVDAALVSAYHRVDRLARDLAAGGTAVLLFSDHGLAANHASEATLEVWREASSPEWCRLPAGGAGRIRWLYPRPGRDERLLELLTGRIGDAVVTTPDGLTGYGLLPPSIGRDRLGEVVLLARGPDFPTPGPDAYEHGSMTADEVLVPMAVWQP